MHFLLTALGSYGDVHPMVGLGATLRKRGHQVTLITNPYFTDVVASAGLELLSLGTAEEYLEMLNLPHLWHPYRAIGLVFRIAVAGKLRELYRLVDSNYVAGETTLVAHPLDAASRVYHEAHRAPLAAVTYSPVSFWSDQAPPDLGTPTVSHLMPWWANRAQFWLGNRLVIERALRHELDALRRDVGLGPSPPPFPNWWYQADLNLALFPDWFARPQPGWPQGLALAGFPLWDGGDSRPLTGPLEEFLGAGEPPLVFAPGSANRQAEAFFQTVVAICQRLGRRGVLLTKYAEQVPSPLPCSIHHEPFVPLRRLLARSALVVHHGGIGTSSQALAAGIPQLIRPLAFDQFDNADRLMNLGVANEIWPRRFTTQRATAAINQLLTSDDVATNCQRWKAKCDGSAALDQAGNLLERVGLGATN